MPRVVFTSNLQRYLDCPQCDVDGATVRAALDQVFATNARLRGYVLDEQGRLRKHVAVYVDGDRIRDRIGLTDTVGGASEIQVLQALSGG